MVRLPVLFGLLRLYLLILIQCFSVNRGCADDCSYEEPKEVKKRK